LLEGARLVLKELKARSTLLDVCTTCPLLRSDLEASTIEIKDLKHKLDLLTTLFYPLCVKHAALSRVGFFMFPKRTLSYNRRLLI
jgi:hypothetical protein